MPFVYNPFTNNLDNTGSGGGGGGGVQTINGISPDGAGEFTIESTDGSVGIAPTANGVDLSVLGTTMLSVTMMNPQSIASGALVDIIYDTVLSDTASAYAAGLYTVPTTGVWLLEYNAVFNATGGFINGDAFITVAPVNFLTHTSSTATVTTPDFTIVSGGILSPLNAGDIVSVKVLATTVGGGSFNVEGYANGFYNNFRMILQ